LAKLTVIDERQREHQLLSVRQASAQYGIGKTAIYAALGNETLSAVVLGKRGTRIRRGDLEKWIDSMKPYRSKKP